MKWTMQERNKQRKLQDTFLDLPAVKKWEEVYGADYPIAGEGTPTVRQLKGYLFFQHKELLERTVWDYAT